MFHVVECPPQTSHEMIPGKQTCGNISKTIQICPELETCQELESQENIEQIF